LCDAPHPLGWGQRFTLYFKAVEGMSRPLRLEYPGALYHITSRGNAQDNIFRSDDFLSRNEAMLPDTMLDSSVSSTQRHPSRPTSVQVLEDVAREYALKPCQVLDRRVHRDAYRAGVFLLRRSCNMSLKEVTDLAGISPARVSQIQSEIDDDHLPDSLKTIK